MEVDPAPATPAVKSIGIIYPPPELREIVNKTAAYVARVGLAFESELKTKHGNNKKFAFLLPESPFHAYYRHQIEVAANGGNVDAVKPPSTVGAAPGPVGENALVIVPTTSSAPARSTTATSSAIVAAPVVVVKTPQELAAEEARRRSDAFKESVQREIADLRRCKTTPSGSASASERFFVRAPANAAPVDLDIMRLAAQFVARNGSKFLNGLIARESRNPQFDFLNADHMYFPFFQQLVESYVAVLNPPADVVTDLLADAKNPLRVLERCLERLELKQQAEAKQNAEGAEEEERAAAAQIDWGTFTIVQTIEFDAAEDPSLPMPQKTIEDINRQLSAADRAVRAQMSAAQAKPRTGGGDDADDIDMDMDDDVDANLKVAGISGQESLPVGMPSASALLAKATGAVLVSNYDYAAALGYKTATTASSSAALKQVCPICAGEFSPAEMPEHLRIELLDPKWREQRQAQLAKHKTSNIAEADEITRNLERLAKRSRAEMSEEVVVSTPSYITSAPARPQLSDLDIIRSGTQQAPRPIAPAMVQPLALQPTPQPVIPLGSLPVPLSAASAAPIAPPPPPSMHPDRLKSIGVAVPPPPPPPPQPVEEPQRDRALDWQPPTGEPATKKPKLTLLSEDEFTAANPGPIALTIAVPQDDEYAQFNFNGQRLEIQAPSARATFASLKEILSPLLGNLPPNKQKFRLEDGTFPKNEQTLAVLNLKAGTVVELMPKERSRKKKE